MLGDLFGPLSGDKKRAAPSLCTGFQRAAGLVWEQLWMGASIGCQPAETTLTDNLLITLGMQHRDCIVVRS